MSTKTLSLSGEVNARLEAERMKGESFNDVITRSTEKKSLRCIVGFPSVFGTHTGTITRNHDITVQKLYTYPCAGTGGHTEYVSIYGNDADESASWNGYGEGGNTITFESSFTLDASKTYNYEIITGSYPQIHHTEALQTENGWINCTNFVDANGKEYNDWIPAIRLWS